MNRSTKKWLFFLLHLTGFVLLYFVVRDLEWESFFEVLMYFPAWKYLVGLGILSLVYAIKAYRWQILNRSFGIQTHWRTALVFYLSAGFLSVVTPGRLGEFAKIYFLRRRYDIDLTAATSSVILDRIWDLLVLSFAAALSIVLMLSGAGLNLLSLLIIALLFTGSLMVVLAPRIIFMPLLGPFRRFSSLHNKLEKMVQLWSSNRFNHFITALAISSGAFLMLAFIPVLFAGSTPYPVDYTSGLGAISISNILSFIPVTIAGFGTRELVFAKIWDLSHHPKEVAISISTAYFVVTYLGSLLIGGVVYLFNAKRLYHPGEIRRMSSEEKPV
ncbi:MAG: lysylphosphatidylglycerol synthase transmembrane domain-containing protein [Bacteroidota bacterium]